MTYNSNPYLSLIFEVRYSEDNEAHLTSYKRPMPGQPWPVPSMAMTKGKINKITQLFF